MWTVILGYVDAPPALEVGPRFCFESARVCVYDLPAEPDYAALRAHPQVRYANPDGLMVPLAVPAPWDGNGTEDCQDLWELEALEADRLPGTGVSGPVVAILDGGFLVDHDDLGQDKVSGSLDYGDNDWDVAVSWNVAVPAHGTFIAGLIAATADNDVARAGLAPDTRLNLMKIADSSGAFMWSYAIYALSDVADGDLGIRVVNYSIGSHSLDPGFADAVAAVGKTDVLLVAAAGNCGVPECEDADNDAYPMYPANLPGGHILSVAGSTRDGQLNPYSHFGEGTVDLAAPGVDLCSLGVDSTDDYSIAGGTSYAAPLVAAAGALVFEAHPDLTAIEVARILRASAKKSAGLEGTVRSEGVLDVHQALATPMPRLVEPLAVSVDGRGELAVGLSNPGGAGPVSFVLFHGPGFSVVDAEGWDIEPFQAGDAVDLPDKGPWEATSAGTLVHGEVQAHEVLTQLLTLSGRTEGAHPVTLRAVARSADYLNAPYDAGDEDPSGFLSFSTTVTVTSVDALPVDSGLDTGGNTATECSGCGGRPASWIGLLGLLMVRRWSG